MRILITGGNGYIARNLRPLFEKNGYEVIAPSRPELDLLNCDYLATYLKMEKFDAIIHTAARGGRRTKTDTFEEVYIPNVQMFGNLCLANQWANPVPIITIGSGAEFDRRMPINSKREEAIFDKWPIDPYGLSKNIITRQALSDYENIWVLRLFGCFNWDDDPSRFIKAGIENIKRGQPIKVHTNKLMDYFFMDDVFLVMDYILKHGGPRNINLVYDEKMNLLTIANMILKHMDGEKKMITLESPETDSPYTGCPEVLYRLPIADQLYGLEDGIKKTTRILT